MFLHTTPEFNLPCPPPLANADDSQPRAATEAELAKILAWNATDFEFGRSKILHQLVEQEFAKHPDSTALIFADESLSCGELNVRSNQLAHYLRSKGVGRETLVVLAMQRSFEMVIAMLAILKAGGAYVPVDPTYPEDLVKYLFEDAAASFVLTQDRFAEALPAGVATILSMPRDVLLWSEFPKVNPGFVNEPGDAVYSIYTSGTTGRPKGAVNVHEGICNRLHWIQKERPLMASDRVMQKTPFTFDVSVWEFFWPLISGAILVIARPEGHRDPVYLQELIVEQQITTLHFAPAMLNVFLDFPGAQKCTCVRQVFCSGEALPAEVQRRLFKAWPKVDLYNLYGPTEAAVEVTWWPCRRDDARSFVPIGWPIANTQILILDADMRITGINEPGELYIGGVNLARGYHRRPELTAERFVPNPYKPGARLYKTGDLARYLEDGSVQYLGRLDHQVKIGGIRIELEEISSVLMELPQVREAVVVAAQDPAAQTRLLAFVVLAANQQADPEFLKAEAAKKMPSFQVPSAFCFLSELPLNANGKVDRKALPVEAAFAQMNAPLRTEGDSDASPSSLLQFQVKEVWEEIFARKNIGLDDNFFELGGGSLLAARLFVALEKRLGNKTPLGTLAAAPTIRTLTASMAAAGVEASWQSCVLIQPSGCKPPLFITHGIGGNILNFYDLAHCFAPDRPVYGIQSAGLNEDSNPPGSMEAMAARYIQEIQEIQPHGPYFLAGWSYGGVVVFEMARQLLARGEEIGTLAVLDSAIHNSPIELSPAERVRRTAVWLKRKLARDLKDISQMGSGKKIQHFADKVKQVKFRLQHWARLSRERSTEDLVEIRDELVQQGRADEYYRLLARHYFPKPAAVEIAFFEAIDTAVTYFYEPLERWRGLAGKGIKHIKLNADHGLMLYPPAVNILAEQLKPLLDREPQGTAREVKKPLLV